MDAEANMKEQLEVAAEVVAIFDSCSDNGDFTNIQTQNLCHAAYRLAHLIQSMDHWKKI